MKQITQIPILQSIILALGVSTPLSTLASEVIWQVKPGPPQDFVVNVREDGNNFTSFVHSSKVCSGLVFECRVDIPVSFSQDAELTITTLPITKPSPFIQGEIVETIQNELVPGILKMKGGRIGLDWLGDSKLFHFSFQYRDAAGNVEVVYEEVFASEFCENGKCEYSFTLPYSTPSDQIVTWGVRAYEDDEWSYEQRTLVVFEEETFSISPPCFSPCEPTRSEK